MSNRPRAGRATQRRVVGLYTGNRRGDGQGYDCLGEWGRMQELLIDQIWLV